MEDSKVKLVWLVIAVIMSGVLSGFALQRKIKRTSSWNDGKLKKNHAIQIAGEYTNHEQSRVLQYLIPEGISRITGCSIEKAYGAQRFLFVFLTLFLFFLYGLKWFKPLVSILAVLIFYITFIFTFRNHLQESCNLLALTSLLLFWAIREKHVLAFSIVLSLGVLNNETVLFFVPALLMHLWFEKTIFNLHYLELLKPPSFQFAFGYQLDGYS